MKKLLLGTAVALGLAASAGTANATLFYTVWNGTGLSHTATFPVPTTGLVANFSDPGNPINFQDRAGPISPNTFASFFTAPVLAEFVAAGGNALAPMSTSDTGTNISTFIRITETYSSTNPLQLTGSIDHDDGGQIFIDGNTTTSICGNGAEASESTQPCTFPAGTHSLTILYTEDNGSPAILVAQIPPEVAAPEPASLSLIGVGLLGLGFVAAKRRR